MTKRGWQRGVCAALLWGFAAAFALPVHAATDSHLAEISGFSEEQLEMGRDVYRGELSLAVDGDEGALHRLLSAGVRHHLDGAEAELHSAAVFLLAEQMGSQPFLDALRRETDRDVQVRVARTLLNGLKPVAETRPLREGLRAILATN